MWREQGGASRNDGTLTMHWTDDAIVLSLRAHGETAGILEVLTHKHGRHLGVVHGYSSSRVRAGLQPGNSLNVSWRARVAEHLGVIAAELSCARAAMFFDRRSSLIGLNAMIAVAAAVLPEREPHEAAFQGSGVLLDGIAAGDLGQWGPLFVYWELSLLSELGFGLDLSVCAVTGTPDDLTWVSPRTGRAVSRQAGEQYRDRLLPLPKFLREPVPECADINRLSDGLRLTGHFLQRWVLQPLGKEMPFARQRLFDALFDRHLRSDHHG
jgi:DNA repair protein RecO (recombination protein O)